MQFIPEITIKILQDAKYDQLKGQTLQELSMLQNQFSGFDDNDFGCRLLDTYSFFASKFEFASKLKPKQSSTTISNPHKTSRILKQFKKYSKHAKQQSFENHLENLKEKEEALKERLEELDVKIKLKKAKLEANEQSGHRRVRYLNMIEKREKVVEELKRIGEISFENYG